MLDTLAHLVEFIQCGLGFHAWHRTYRFRNGDVYMATDYCQRPGCGCRRYVVLG